MKNSLNMIYTNNNIETSCWYIETWIDEDLEHALETAGIDVTSENVARLRNECLHVFDDKSERNEILADKARNIFKGISG